MREKELKQRFGAAFVKECTDKGISPYNVEDLTGGTVSRGMMNFYYQGHSLPTPRAVCALAEIGIDFPAVWSGVFE